MQILNLYSDHDTYRINPNITDRRFLELEIAKWLVSDKRRRQLDGERYYDGNHDIMGRKRTVIGEGGEQTECKHLPNNRIVDNLFAKMVDQKANYLCGKPVTFDTANAYYTEALASVFTKKLQRSLRIAAEKALIGGISWLAPYYNDSGNLLFSVFPAHEILPFWTDAGHTELDCAVHFFDVYAYDNDGNLHTVHKVEVFHGGGIDRFVWEDGTLTADNNAVSGSYVTVVDSANTPHNMNWSRIPLVCFKYNHSEIPLLCRVRSLQDALNLLLSNFTNAMTEDVHNTVLVIHNYDGENLGEFRHNLATYGAVKVRSGNDGGGGVDTLTVNVNADNYKAVCDMLKRAIIENARGYDAKDERMSGTPNQMNIRSMYSDIDLDANGMETEFQASFDDLLFFVNAHLANTGKGYFEDERVSVIFNRDILVNESEVIADCEKSLGIISRETVIKQHPWIDNPSEELKRVRSEQEADNNIADIYSSAFDKKGDVTDEE